MKFKDSELDRCKGSIENLNHFNKDLEKEISRLREEMLNYGSQINDGKNDTIKVE